VTQPATVPKLKSVRAAGKQETPAQSRSGAPDNASVVAAPLTPFQQAMRAIQEQWLGPPAGRPGSVGRLVEQISQCELSTKRAILEAQPTEKLPAFDSGFKKLQENLCASATACYRECFKRAVANQAELDAPPAEFASSFTLARLSELLRVTALDGEEEVREIDRNGRVRWFVRHACCDWSDDFPSSYGLDAGLSVGFQLPQYLSGVWRVRAMLAQRAGYPNGLTVPLATDQLSTEETETFILDKEQILVKELRDAIADVHRETLIGLGATPASKTGETAPSTQAPAVQGLPKVQNESGTDRLEAIRRKITGRPEGWITNKEAALYYGCALKTIRDWKDVGKLDDGPKRSSVSNKSILELEGKTAKPLRVDNTS
jgi:hypothetical protein